MKVACPLEAIDDCTNAVTKTLLKTRIWWQNSYHNIFVVFSCLDVLQNQNIKKLKAAKTNRKLFFSFHSNCQILHGHLAFNARHGGRALTRGGCLHKEIR